MNLVDTFVRVELEQPDDFLKVKETLTRIGVASEKQKRLFQSCHILHKRGNYYILHFKELFLLDGRESTLDDEDIGRRNTIANLLEDWGLLKVAVRQPGPLAPVKSIKILSFGEKKDWDLVSKYRIGKK